MTFGSEVGIHFVIELYAYDTSAQNTRNQMPSLKT
jgi:hypothetical protein